MERLLVLLDMNRRIILIILGGLLFALLLALVWFWFFRGSGAPAAPPTGSFGSGQDRGTGTGTTNFGQNNGASQVPSDGNNASTGGTVTNGGTTNVDLGTVGTVPGVAQVPGVQWLGGSGGIGGGPITTFTPSAINQLNDGTVGGSPAIIGGFGNSGDGSGGLGLGGALLGAGIAGAVSCSGFLASGIAGTVTSASIVAVQVNNPTSNSKQVLDCFTRVIAKVALQQMTASIVNWINSGFNGKPSFVRNYQNFFTNIADQAAGEFIRGTSLSFLCSPFQAQIKIAIAQSYARRNSGASCTLSGVIKNVNSFMNGNFAQGGWGGLLQFTTIPTNNPYGAYAYAQIGLVNAQQQALNNASRNLSPGGFIALQKETDCQTVGIKTGTGDISGARKVNCKTETSTPGTIIEESLASTLQVSKDTLVQAGVSGSFDAIISALITQLMTKTLYSGLSSLSGTQGYASDYLTPEQQQAQADAQALLTDMQGKVQFAQQYGQAQQGSISDIQAVQQNLQTLANCWEVASSSPDLATGKQQQAKANAQTVLGIIASYNTQVAALNDNITRANVGIAKLQDLQTAAIGVTSAADVAAVKAAYQSALASGTLITQADVTQAQQDRASLQASLATRNAQTQTELNQCYAF